MATVTILPTANTVAGSPRFTSTFNYSGGAVIAELQIVSTTWATDDPTITVAIEVQESFDGGVTWSSYVAMTTHPQLFEPKTGALPLLKCDCGDDLGKRKVRGMLSVDKLQLSLGVTATA